MIVLYILAGLLALILLLLCIPVQIEAKYSQQLSLRIKYLFIPFQILPKKPEEEKKPKGKAAQFFSDAGKKVKKAWRKGRKKLSVLGKKIKAKLGIGKKPVESKPQEQKTAKKEKSAFASLREERGFSGMVLLLWRVVSLASGAFGKVLRGMTVQRFDFRAKIGGDDAADIAVSYGKWCAVLYPALGFVLGCVKRYRKNIEIVPDFAGGETAVEADVLMRCFPILLIHHGLTAFLRLLFSEIKDAVKQKVNDASAQASINITQGGAVQ